MSVSKLGLFLVSTLMIEAAAEATTSSGAVAGAPRLEPPLPLREVAAGADLPALVPGPRPAGRVFEENRGQYPAYIGYLWNWRSTCSGGWSSPAPP